MPNEEENGREAVAPRKTTKAALEPKKTQINEFSIEECEVRDQNFSSRARKRGLSFSRVSPSDSQ